MKIYRLSLGRGNQKRFSKVSENLKKCFGLFIMGSNPHSFVLANELGVKQ